VVMRDQPTCRVRAGTMHGTDSQSAALISRVAAETCRIAAHVQTRILSFTIHSVVRRAGLVRNRCTRAASPIGKRSDSEEVIRKSFVR